MTKTIVSRPFIITLSLLTTLALAATLWVVQPKHEAEAQPACGDFVLKWGSQGNQVFGLDVDSLGDVYVADKDNHRIQVFDSNGTFLRKWGLFGTGDGQFNGPFDLALDTSNNVYVSDNLNRRVQVFDSSGTFLTKWGSPGTGSTQFTNILGIEVDSSGNVYVADGSLARIQKFDSLGNPVNSFSGGTSNILGSFGAGDGQFNAPFDVAVDSSGNIYVADYFNRRVQKFDSSGNFLLKWGSHGSGDGEFNNSPRMIDVDSLDNVWVADSNNHRVQVFDSNGTFLSKIGTFGTGDGQFNYTLGIAADTPGVVYVSDFSPNRRIQKLVGGAACVPPPPPPPCGDFLLKWGTSGSGDGQFILPREIALDSSDNVYVVEAHPNQRVQKFDSLGIFITKWGSFGSGDGQFNQPYGIAIDSFDKVYVTESSNHRVQKFTSSGSFDTKWGSSGTGDGQLSTPLGNAVDSSGNVYVADFGNHRVQKFTSSGTFLGWWGRDDLGGSGFHAPGSGRVGASGAGNGEFNKPYAIALDSSDNVYVTDWNNRVQKFDSSGGFIKKWGSTGGGDGQFRLPLGIAVDSSDYVYVADSNNHRVQKFTSSGTFITKWGSLGAGDGQFNVPQGIVVDPSGNVYVTDVANRRVQKFSCTLLPPILDSDGDGVLDDEDACVDTPGTVFQGCPFVDRTAVNVHAATTGGEFQSNEGTSIKVFDRSDAAFQSEFGTNLHVNDYPAIYESGLGEIGSCQTKDAGSATAEEPLGACMIGEDAAGEYLVLAKFDSHHNAPLSAAPAYGGYEKSPSDFVNGIADKEVNFLLTTAKGQQQANWVKRIRYSGSVLDVYYSAGGAIVDGDKSYYPYLFISDSNWDVDVCAEVPAGYVVSAVYDENGNIITTDSCLQALVANESKTFLFESTEIGSPEPSLTANINVKGPDGKKHNLKVQAKNARKATHEAKVNKAKGHKGKGKFGAVMERLNLGSAAPKLAPLSANVLNAGESLWKFALRHLGPAPASNLANLVLKLAGSNDIAIPEWGVAGSLDSRALKPGLKLLGL